MTAWVLRGVRVLDGLPSDLVLADGVVAAQAPARASVLDAGGLIVLPGNVKSLLT